MSIDVNLISKSSENAKDVRLKRIKTFSLVALFVVGILSVVFFLINFRFSASYVKGQQSKLITDLSAYEDVANKIFFLHQRLADVSELLSSRKKYHEKVEKIIEKIPSSVAIVEFKADQGGISMEVSSTSLLELNKFLNDMLLLSESNVFSAVALDGLTYSKSEFVMKVNAN